MSRREEALPASLGPRGAIGRILATAIAARVSPDLVEDARFAEWRVLHHDLDAESACSLLVAQTALAIVCRFVETEAIAPGTAAAIASLTGAAAARRYTSAIEGRAIARDRGVAFLDEDRVYGWVAEATDRALGAALVELARAIPSLDACSIQQLHHVWIPRPLRHALGEHYTPRWLVEHALDAVGWEGVTTLAATLCDPTCGAGAFLVPAIARLRRTATTAGWDRRRTVDAIATRVIGDDLHPLALRAARASWLAAIADLLDADREITVPIARRDALAAGPAVDVLVGNPPWVRWSALAGEARSRALAAGRAHGLAPERAYFGGAELDLSALVVYATAHERLATGGRLAFVIPQTHLQSPSARCFRRFQLRDGTALEITSVDDWSAVRAFVAVGARPCTLVARKGSATRYPLAPYRVWRRQPGARLDAAAGWRAIQPLLTVEEREALPLPGDGRWAIFPRGTGAPPTSLAGPDPVHRGRKGVTCDLNGAYFVTLLGAAGPGLVRVRSDGTASRRALPSREITVEAELVHPLLKGAGEISPFRVAPTERAVILPNQRIARLGLAASLADTHPRAWAHFSSLRAQLEARSTFRTRLAATGAPWWAVYNVGPYTFAPWKVVWAEQSTRLVAAVVGPRALPPLPARPVVPDHKVYFVACATEDEAHHLCALLNAPSVARAIDAITVKLQVGTLFRHLRLPAFAAGDPLHRRLAELSRRAHASGNPPDPAVLDELARRALDAGAQPRAVTQHSAPPADNPLCGMMRTPAVPESAHQRQADHRRQ